MNALAATANFGESYVLEIVGLVLVAGVIMRWVAPWLRTAMRDQADSIRGQLAAGEELKATAERLVAIRTAELDAARAEAEAIVRQAGESAAQLVADGRRRAAEERERLVARAATEVELARARARDEITARFASLVVEVAEEVVVAELDDALHHHLIDDAIAAAESEVA